MLGEKQDYMYIFSISLEIQIVCAKTYNMFEQWMMALKSSSVPFLSLSHFSAIWYPPIQYRQTSSVVLLSKTAALDSVIKPLDRARQIRFSNLVLCSSSMMLFSYSSASSFIASFNVLKRTLMFSSIQISASVLFRKVLLSSCNLPAVCSRVLRSQT